MKKFFLMLLSLMLAATTLAAFAEDAAIIPSPGAADIDDLADTALEGFVMDVQDGVLLLQTREGQRIEALLTADTFMDGSEPAIGDYVHITYDGMMTKSIPAQITAQYVGDYVLMGLVSDMTEEGFLLTYGEDAWQVNATEAQLALIQDGMFITVFHNGIMTRSIPAQVTADHVRGMEIVGTVIEMVEGGFTMTVEGEELPYHVALKEDAMSFVQAEPGMTLIVVTDSIQTVSAESILVNAVEVLPLPAAEELFDMTGTVTEITEEGIFITTADGRPMQILTNEETLHEGKDAEVGDYIHVTYNGQMTRSIPAQINALKIGCYTHTGVVSEISEEQFTLTTEAETILVNAAAELLANLTDGMTVTVYSNGAMTMSLPAQIGAELITATAVTVD